MAQGTRDIRRRLKTVGNIKKITRAMELVSAAKMRRSVARVLASRAYAESAWDVVLDLIPTVNRALHPLIEERPVSRALIVVVGTNRGLCGAFNMNVVSKAIDLVGKENWNSDNVDYITFGKRSGQILSTLKKRVVADYPKDDITQSIDKVVPLARELIELFTEKKYDEICLAYTDFKSSLRQEARIRHLLPLAKPSRYLGLVGREDGHGKSNGVEYLFEPSRDTVLEAMLPRLVEVQVYQAVLESEASEHSARMMAMRNATDSAVDMIDNLTLVYNQARQAAITSELAELTAAGAAVREVVA